MNLETLKLYCDVVRLQSFSQAAKACQITQSAASQAIQQIEQQLGTQLIDRSTRPFTITPDGQLYYNGVRTLLTEYAKLEAELKQSNTSVEGDVRIAAIYSVGLYDLNRHLQGFTVRYPQVKVRLEYLRPNMVQDAILNDEADLGILSYARSNRIVECVPWRSEKMVFVCHPSHRLAAKTMIGAADLEGEKFIHFDPDLPIRKAIDKSLKKNGTKVEVVMEFDNIETMKQAIEINAGVSILPEPTVKNAVEARRLIAVPLAMTELVRPVGIIYRRNKTLTPAMQRLIDLLKLAEGAGMAKAS